MILFSGYVVSFIVLLSVFVWFHCGCPSHLFISGVFLHCFFCWFLFCFGCVCSSGVRVMTKKKGLPAVLVLFGAGLLETHLGPDVLLV